MDEESSVNSEQPLAIINCGGAASPKTRNLSSIAFKEDGFKDGYDSDGELGPC